MNQSVQELIKDPMAVACADTLRPLLQELGYAGIISIGLPRVLYPHMDLVRNWPIQVYEVDAFDNYNYPSNSVKGYLKSATAELQTMGFVLEPATRPVVLADVKFWKWFWPEALGTRKPPEKMLMLLDTCNLTEIQNMHKTDSHPASGSVIMFNSNNRRHPNAVLPYAERIAGVDSPLRGAVTYQGRTAGGQRLITFWQKV